MDRLAKDQQSRFVAPWIEHRPKTAIHHAKQQISKRMTSPANHRRGFSVNVFLPSGDPDGLKVVEKSNWTGRGLVIPRPMFAESRARLSWTALASICWLVPAIPRLCRRFTLARAIP
jgi:hypothetical protein